MAFDLTTEAESQLRKAGADDLLLDEIKEIRAEASKRKKTNESQLGQGTKGLTAALTGIRDQLDYLNSTRTGVFWDPNKEIRAQIRNEPFAARGAAARLAEGANHWGRDRTETSKKKSTSCAAMRARSCAGNSSVSRQITLASQPFTP